MTLTLDKIRRLSVPGVTEAEMDEIRALVGVWRDRLDSNLKRTLYYDGEQVFKDLGLMLPPQLKNAKFYLGWATMAVRKPAIRSQFDGLRLPGSDDPFGLSDVLSANDFGLEVAQAVHAGYKHGVSFFTVTKGMPGEPEVIIQAHDAETSAALWDRRRRQVRSALTIQEMNEHGPTAFVVYLRDWVLLCYQRSSGRWASRRVPNRLGRAPVVPVPYDPQIRKPFGRSRISRPVMSLTDMAVRAYVRMEGNAEFYSSPQVAIEGVDPDAFENVSEQRRFQLAMDRLVALTRDADGNAPTIKQLQQATMTPHSDMLRTVAMAFSGETGIPPSALGIIHDQPSSAEAIRAAEHDLLIDVTYQNNFVLSSAVKQVAQLVLMIRDNLTELPVEAHRLSAAFLDPEFRSTSAKADAAVKLASIPSLQNSTVILEDIFDQDKLERIRAEQRRANAGENLRALLESRRNTEAGRGVDSADESDGSVMADAE